MRCPQCGNEVETGLSFCPQCGTAVKASEEGVAASAQAPQPVPGEAGAMQPTVTAGREPGSVDGAMEREQEDGNPAAESPLRVDGNAAVELPPRRKKGRKAALIAAICVVAAGVLSLAGYLLYPTVRMAVYGPARYYAMQETRLLEEDPSTGEAVATAPITTEGEYRVKMELPDTGDPATDEALAELFENLRVRVSGRADPAQLVSSTEMELLVGDDSLLTCRLDQRDGRQGISFPGLSDGQIVSRIPVDLQALLTDGSFGGLTEAEQRAMLIEYLEDVLFTPLDGGTVQTGKATRGGISCTTHTFVLDQALCRQMADALAEKLETDERLVKLMLAWNDLAMGQSGAGLYADGLSADSLSEEEIRQVLREVAARLRDGSDTESSTPATFVVYYDGRGRLVARELTFADDSATGTLGYAQYRQDGKEIYEFSLSVQPESGDPVQMTVHWESAGEDGRLAGNLRVVWEEGSTRTEVLRLSCDLTEAVVAGSTTYTGTVEAALDLPVPDQEVSLRLSLEDTLEGENTLRQRLRVEMQLDGQPFSVEMDGTQTCTPGADLSEVSVAEETTMDESDMYALGQAISQNLIPILYPLLYEGMTV